MPQKTSYHFLGVKKIILHASTKNYVNWTFIFMSLLKDAGSIAWFYIQILADYMVLFLLDFLPVPLFPRFVMIKDRSHVPASRLSIVRSDRHVSDDFPIKPAEQLSIDGNQRLLSACPAIILDVEARSWLFMIVPSSQPAIFCDLQSRETENRSNINLQSIVQEKNRVEQS